MNQHPTLPDIFVDEDGVVFRKLPHWVDTNGYHVVNIGHVKIRRHTLVCEAFHGERPAPGFHVRHLDGYPANNHPDNLAWGTPTQNGADTIAHGRTTRGEKNHHAILTHDQAQEAWDRYKAGESALSVALDLGVSAACIHDIAKRRTWPEIERKA
jgi:hypothetical protein